MVIERVSDKAEPLVSIIMPVYNGANYLRQAIDSALAQTYKNIEIIVINDGSNDNGQTESIAKSYGDKIRYLYKENGGVATALNVGIQNSRGDYVSWLSHDDLYCANKIERQVACLASTTSANVVIYCDYTAIDANNNLLQTARLACQNGFDHKQEFLFNMFTARLHGCSLLIPKKCFTDVGYFDESLRTTQDYDLWFNFLRHGYEFRHVPELLIRSRWHKEQGTYTLYKIAQREIEALYVGAVDKFYDDLERMPIATIVDLIVDLRARKLKKTTNHLLKSIRQRNRRLHQQMYAQYRHPLFASKIKLMMEKPRHICAIINNLLRIRGRG